MWAWISWPVGSLAKETVTKVASMPPPPPPPPPSTLSALVVRIFLVAAALPALRLAAKAIMGIMEVRKFFSLRRMYYLILLQWLGIAILYFYDRFDQPNRVSQVWHKLFSPIGTLGQVGPNGLSFGGVYNSLFQTLVGSWWVWRVCLPAYILFTVYHWAMFIYRDFFITFKDLGLGGSGTSFRGWALARIREWVANVDVMRPPRVPQTADPYRGRLDVLPQRQGPRPTILGVTPQRQVDYPSPPNTQLVLERLMAEFVDDTDPSDQIEVRRSFLERGLPALRRKLTIPTDSEGGPLNPKDHFDTADTFGGEIFHPHRDGTSHVVLHPEDCRRVMEAGWGQRHPFCTTSWYWKLYFNRWLGIRLPVPEGLIILYAPRHQGEYEVIRHIIQAAVWNATDGRLHPIDADTYPVPPAPAPNA